MSRSEYKPEDPLLNVKEAAAERGCGVSTWWRDVRAGLLPEPIYITPKSPRWRLSEIQAAIERCPRGNENRKKHPEARPI